MIDDTALTILRTVQGASAVTLEGGYAVFAGPAIPDMPTGRTLFEPARMDDVRRNEKGRCTHAIARYRDGSSLTFTWNQARGHRYVHTAAQETTRCRASS